MKLSRPVRRFLPALALALAFRAHASPEDSHSLGLDALDAPMPATRLIAAGGAPSLDLASLRGRPVLLHFWATWCAPCRREMPLLAALPERLKSIGLSVVFVDIDPADQEPAAIKFAADTAVRAPVYMAVPSGLNSDFWTWGVPVTYLIGSDGRIKGRFLGPRPWDSAVFAAALTTTLNSISK